MDVIFIKEINQSFTDLITHDVNLLKDTQAQQDASIPWSGRYFHTSVALPDGSIVLMGGLRHDSNGPSFVMPMGDVWISNDKGRTWTQQTSAAPWLPRLYHTSTALPDGSIVLMGGLTFFDGKKDQIHNDVWISSDKGKTWTLVTPSANWSERSCPVCVAFPDGALVLMGGYLQPGVPANDVWLSLDKGKTWTLQNPSAEWSARSMHGCVVLQDNKMALIGGLDNNTDSWKDIWCSPDKGRTWTRPTAAAPWSRRWGQSIVALSDGSIIMTGGYVDSRPYFGYNDVWISMDMGKTWAQQTPAAGWRARGFHTSVVLPDQSIIILGGLSWGCPINDVWQSYDKGRTWNQPKPNY